MTDGLIVDLFAGGGGMSVALEAELGRPVDVAINHSAKAVLMHAENHPHTRHLCGSVHDYAPREATRGYPVWWLHASPTCTHFSRAKGHSLDRAKASRERSLAWVILRYARDTVARPRIISMENVPAFESWGPLLNDGKPCPRRRGMTFRRFVRELEREGYKVEWRTLRACDFGAPTSRERLFLVARCDGEPIVWPLPTHGTAMWEQPYRTAAECIDWSIPCPSIHGRKKPLVPATLDRVMRGLKKFVLDEPSPFVVEGSIPWLIHQSNGERPGQAPRVYDIRKPLSTVVAGGVKHGLVRAFIAKDFGGHASPGIDLRQPLSTITTRDHHALVTAHGDPIFDIGKRSLVGRELFRAQGFPDTYRIDMLGETAQVQMAGNSVPPPMGAAVVRANRGASRRVAA